MSPSHLRIRKSVRSTRLGGVLAGASLVLVLVGGHMTPLLALRIHQAIRHGGSPANPAALGQPLPAAIPVAGDFVSTVGTGQVSARPMPRPAVTGSDVENLVRNPRSGSRPAFAAGRSAAPRTFRLGDFLRRFDTPLSGTRDGVLTVTVLRHKGSERGGSAAAANAVAGPHTHSHGSTAHTDTHAAKTSAEPSHLALDPPYESDNPELEARHTHPSSAEAQPHRHDDIVHTHDVPSGDENADFGSVARLYLAAGGLRSDLPDSPPRPLVQQPRIPNPHHPGLDPPPPRRLQSTHA